MNISITTDKIDVSDDTERMWKECGKDVIRMQKGCRKSQHCCLLLFNQNFCKHMYGDNGLSRLVMPQNVLSTASNVHLCCMGASSQMMRFVNLIKFDSIDCLDMNHIDVGKGCLCTLTSNMVSIPKERDVIH